MGRPRNRWNTVTGTIPNTQSGKGEEKAEEEDEEAEEEDFWRVMNQSSGLFGIVSPLLLILYLYLNICTLLEVYAISYRDCDQKFVGQTQRSIITSFKERMAHSQIQTNGKI